MGKFTTVNASRTCAEKPALGAPPQQEVVASNPIPTSSFLTFEYTEVDQIALPNSILANQSGMLVSPMPHGSCGAADNFTVYSDNLIIDGFENSYNVIPIKTYASAHVYMKPCTESG